MRSNIARRCEFHDIGFVIGYHSAAGVLESSLNPEARKIILKDRRD